MTCAVYPHNRQLHNEKNPSLFKTVKSVSREFRKKDQMLYAGKKGDKIYYHINHVG